MPRAAPPVASVLVAAVLAGCASTGPMAPPAEGEGPAPEEPRLDGVTLGNSLPPAASNESWGRLRIIARGEPGTWLLAWAPLPGNASRVAWETDGTAAAEATAEGGPIAYFLPPRPVADRGDGLELGRALERAAFHTRGGAFSRSYEMASAQSCSSCTYRGFLVAMGSTGAWSLNLTVTLEDDGAAVGPSHVWGGPGVRFGVGARAAPIAAGPIGEVRAEVDVPGEGWTHLGVLYRPLQPVGVRQFDVAFPNGFAHREMGRRTGHCTPVGGGMSYGGEADFLGTLDDVRGTMRAAITHVGADLEFDLAWFHFPGRIDLPHALAGRGYAGLGQCVRRRISRSRMTSSISAA